MEEKMVEGRGGYLTLFSLQALQGSFERPRKGKEAGHGLPLPSQPRFVAEVLACGGPLSTH